MIKYCGKPLFSVEFPGDACELVLDQRAVVGDLRKFISRELMLGTDYRSAAARELAFAISRALMSPMLRYVQCSLSGRGQWVAFIERWAEGQGVHHG